MPGFPRNLTVHVGDHAYKLRVLSDRQQFADPARHGERLGVSSVQWNLSGQLWPSGRLLAQAMNQADIAGKHVWKSVAASAWQAWSCSGAAVAASDMHPLTESLLACNAALNDLPALHFRHLRPCSTRTLRCTPVCSRTMMSARLAHRPRNDLSVDK